MAPVRAGVTCLGLGLHHIVADIFGQHIQRHIAALDDNVVEIPQIIGITQRRLCKAALADDFAVADFVAASLTRPAAITVNFAADFERVRSIFLDKEFDALFACPPRPAGAWSC